MDSRALGLVTGAARRLGRAFAITLAHEGYAVGLHYRSSAEEARQTADELSDLGSPVFLLRADLTDSASLTQLFDQLDGIPYPLKVLVNSAGRFGPGDPRELTSQEWDAILDLNVRAAFFCSQKAAERMSTGGLIVNIGDIAARKAWGRFAAYAASKAALESLTRSLARAYGPSIRVNAIAPGLILRSSEPSVQDWARLIARVPMRRAGTLDEVVDALRFLLHNEYVTGQTIAVDGGYELVA